MPHRSTGSTPDSPSEQTSLAETGAPLTRREAREREGRLRSADVRSAPDAAPTASRPPHSTAEPVFASRRDRRAAEGHQARVAPAPRGSSFFRPSRRHLVLAMSGGLVVVAVATGASLTIGASGSAESASATSAGTPSPTATPTTVAVLPATTASERVVLSAVSTTTGTVAGGTSVTLSGSNLDAVATVRFGDAEGAVAVENADQITVTAPPASGEAEGVVPVAFFDADGAPITFDAVTDAAAAVTVDGTPAESVQSAVDSTDADADTTAVPAATAEPAADLEAPTATASPSPTATGVLATTKVVASAITFAYTPDPAIEAAKAAAALEASRLASQLDYLETYWSDYNSAQYGVISGNDCVNFASQSLIARGWTMDAEWSYSSTGGYSSAWASSTAFNSYLAAHPERATALSDAQRDQVKVGDVVQFDWDGSGDWDHTGIVTSVDGDTILYSSHTVDNFDQSIDSASAARIMFWSV
ncbi:CHAP domain-containing protein [Rathayibacter sp. VKM Ac-2759]|uniref:amidase domain-containing protein n=1 Tax=Rathayibacter sp. VKM Ac-2759 TaxID=2609252 RepID=UPI0013194A89|nr:amidase domain-containing protein [Rathayibacter sp. VKM Ac-2759]QHC67585.1 CHAP domain-containing protein [Rathayibacter sp. VKM Ac-2759]